MGFKLESRGFFANRLTMGITRDTIMWVMEIPVHLLSLGPYRTGVPRPTLNLGTVTKGLLFRNLN